MSKLSDIKLQLLQGDYSRKLWYITKQNCNFRDLAMMARILEMWDDDPSEAFQTYFDRIKKTEPFSDYIENSPHRALKNCEFYGLMTPSNSKSKSAYSSANLTDVYQNIKILCNGEFSKVEKYQSEINNQLEHMNITVDGKDVNPIMYTLKVLLVLGDATGSYKVQNKEFKLFVSTCNEWNQFFQSVESIIRFRTDVDYQNQALKNYDIANDTRFNLVFDNLSYIVTEGNSIAIKDGCVEEVRRKVAEYELGSTIESGNPSVLYIPTSISESSNSMLLSYLAALRTKPFMLLAGISGTGKSRIVRKLAQASTTEELQKTYDPKSVENSFDRWQIHKPANFEIVQVKPNWHNSLEVVGYKSNIGGAHYEFTPFVEFLARAWKHQNVPFFLCLDEMNLAPVEQYFAEFLSAIESRSIEHGEYETDPIIKPFKEFGKDVCNQMIDHLVGTVNASNVVPGSSEAKLVERYMTKGLTLPKNLLVLGTVNMDDTTFSFSRKVLDRAMSIVMNDVEYNKFFTGETENDMPEFNDATTNLLIERPIRGLDAKDNGANKVKEYLTAVNTVLHDSPFKLGYRAANEALLYVSAVHLFDSAIEVEAALDEFTLMKILSRIEGDKRSIGNLLNDLQQVINGDYPKSNARLVQMAETLKDKQFVSYWT